MAALGRPVRGCAARPPRCARRTSLQISRGNASPLADAYDLGAAAAPGCLRSAAASRPECPSIDDRDGRVIACRSDDRRERALGPRRCSSTTTSPRPSSGQKNSQTRDVEADRGVICSTRSVSSRPYAACIHTAMTVAVGSPEARPLGCAGRAGGVDHVGQVLGPSGHGPVAVGRIVVRGAGPARPAGRRALARMPPRRGGRPHCGVAQHHRCGRRRPA